MARKKAEKEIVELSEEEQPYELPEGWKWERLGSINKFKSKNLTPQDFPEEIFELYSVPNFICDYPEILKGKEIGSSKQIVDKDDVLLCKINPNINRVWTVQKYTNNRIIASGEWIVFRNSEINSRMIKWYFTSPYFRTLMMSNVSGVGGSLTRAKPKLVSNYLLPIPPKETQQKIVDIIESLFAKLDIAQEKVEQVLAESENRRSAILHNAFNGKLTEKWRKENGVSFDSWKNMKISDIFSLKAGKTISAKNISDTYDDINKYECYGGNGIRGYVESFNREGEHPIIGRQGALCGNIHLATGKFYATEHAVVVDYLYDTDTMWAVENLRFLNLNQYSASVAQPGLAVKKIMDILITFPSYEEQREIGKLLSKLLSVEDKVKSTCQSTLETIATMRKSILAKAFRGELCS